jgi:hypothetical protein
MVNLRLVRRAVEIVDNVNKDMFFHSLVHDLAKIIGYKRNKEWYEASTIVPRFCKGRVFKFNSLSELEACLEEGILLAVFDHRIKYVKDTDTLIASTIHKLHEDFIRGDYYRSIIASNTNLGLDYKVLTPEELELRYPSESDKPPVRVAYEKKCLILNSNNCYLMHPGYLLEVFDKERANKSSP